MEDIQYYNGLLYGHYGFTHYRLDRRVFKLSRDHPKLKWKHPRICIDSITGFIYEYYRSFTIFNGKEKIHLPSKWYKFFGFKLIILESVIYFFDREHSHHEKYDISTRNWIRFKCSHPKINYRTVLENVILFNNSIYFLHNDGKLMLYNHKTNLLHYFLDVTNDSTVDPKKELKYK